MYVSFIREERKSSREGALESIRMIQESLRSGGYTVKGDIGYLSICMVLSISQPYESKNWGGILVDL